jgi:hypothetical protein
MARCMWEARKYMHAYACAVEVHVHVRTLRTERDLKAAIVVQSCGWPGAAAPRFIRSEDVSSPRLPPIRCRANNDACRARRSTATSNLARRVGSLHQIRSVRDPRSERPLVTCIWGGVSVTASVDRYGIEKVREQCKHRSTRAGGQLQLAPTPLSTPNKQASQPAAAADVRPRHRARGGRAKRRKRRVRTCARRAIGVWGRLA